MRKTKIVVTDHIEPDFDWENRQLERYDVIFEHYQLKFAPAAELIEKVRDADVVVVNMAPITAEVIDALERCRLIIRHGIGYDRVDVAAATRRGIRVANVPDYCAQEVAEQTLMLIFACVRRLLDQRMALLASSQKGTWDFTAAEPIYSLAGKTLGIIGCGRIGSLVYKKTQGLEMKYIICDPYLSERRVKQMGIEVVSKEEVLDAADVVTLHTPLNEETRHLIGEKELQRMKPTAYLINTARGDLIDVEALRRALEDGEIAGAGIDVYDREPPAADFALWRTKHATLTPHLAWYSEESGWSIREKILEDVVRFIEGRPPRFLVNEEVEEIIRSRART